MKIDIPPQELSAALKLFASQTNTQILYATEVLQGVRTHGVSGNYTPEAALKLLLSGSGASYRTSGENAYIISPAAKTGETGSGQAHRLGEVVVTATRSERRVEEVPASVSIITSEDISRQHVVSTEDVLKNVEGIDIKKSAGFPTEVYMRGLGSTFAGASTLALVDGMPVEPVLISRRTAWGVVSPGDVERVEVVRGPSSALYGPGAAGGVINIITKRGEEQPSLEAKLGYGSHQSKLLGISAGGQADNLDFRVSANQYETDGYIAQPISSGSGADLAGRDGKNKNLNVRLGLRSDADREISAGYHHIDFDNAWYGGHPNDRWTREGDVFDIGFRNRFSDSFQLKGKFLTGNFDLAMNFDKEYVNGTVGNLALAQVEKENEFAQTAELQGDIKLNEQNTLITGISYSTGKRFYRTENASGGFISDLVAKSKVSGVFLQDEHKFSKSAALTLGGRYDEYEFYDDTRSGTAYPGSKDHVFLPRAGLNFGLGDNTSLYASFGKAYLPALNALKFRGSASWLDNAELKPEKSTSYEVGLNHDFRNGLKGRVTTFHTDYTDKITSIKVGAKNQYQNIGKVEVDGLETSLEGWLSDHWRPYVNYAYTNAIIAENPADLTTVGKHPSLSTRHKLNLGIAYEAPKSYTAQLMGRYVGERYYDDKNTQAAKAGGYFVADAKLTINLPTDRFLGKADISLAVNNLFDHQYSEYRNEWSDTRNYWVELSAKF